MRVRMVGGIRYGILMMMRVVKRKRGRRIINEDAVVC